jgi:hypothetical protein
MAFAECNVYFLPELLFQKIQYVQKLLVRIVWNAGLKVLLVSPCLKFFFFLFTLIVHSARLQMMPTVSGRSMETYQIHADNAVWPSQTNDYWIACGDYGT